jgi:hypothetical protein
MINEPDHPAGCLQIALGEESIMLKTISAALLAVSMIAAPALAAGTGKTARVPTAKTLNARAQMGHHHHKHYYHHHVRHHHHMGAVKSHSKVSFRHAAPTAKHG